MKRVAIPALQSGNEALDRQAAAVKQNVDMVTGQHKNSTILKPLSLAPLDTAATLAATIAYVNTTTAALQAQLNAILARIQGDQ